jgi:TPP-dependent pyruvate/acetoin dehydrogenase alpha subunit
LISREKMIALYSAMVKYRLLTAQTEQFALLGNLAKAEPLCPGLEATVAAITADLGPRDSFFAVHRQLAAFVRGTPSAAPPLKSLHARDGHPPPPQPIENLAAANETAAALQASKGDGIALAFCSEPVKHDIWRSQLQQASRANLPVIFVHLLVAARAAKAARKVHSAPQARAYGVPLIAVDANDVLAIYRVASESIARARQRRGPTLIQCVHFEHTPRSGTPPAGADPVRAMELTLVRKRILNADLKEKIETRARRELRATLR